MSWLYTTKAQALAEGFNHEGTHFGVPVWAEYDDASGEMGIVAAKCGALEWALTVGAILTQAVNAFREPGDEFMFAFCIRPIQ